MTLDDVLTDTTRKFQSCIDCFRPVPNYLRTRVMAIYEMENDYGRGLEHLLDGLIAERDYLKEVLHE